MSGVYLRDGAKLKSYSATTKGKKSVVKIEIEFDDHYELGVCLSGLERLDAEQKAAAKKKPLAIPDLRGVK